MGAVWVVKRYRSGCTYRLQTRDKRRCLRWRRLPRRRLRSAWCPPGIPARASCWSQPSRYQIQGRPWEWSSGLDGWQKVPGAEERREKMNKNTNVKIMLLHSLFIMSRRQSSCSSSWYWRWRWWRLSPLSLTQGGCDAQGDHHSQVEWVQADR